MAVAFDRARKRTRAHAPSSRSRSPLSAHASELTLTTRPYACSPAAAARTPGSSCLASATCPRWLTAMCGSNPCTPAGVHGAAIMPALSTSACSGRGEASLLGTRTKARRAQSVSSSRLRFQRHCGGPCKFERARAWRRRACVPVPRVAPSPCAVAEGERRLAHLREVQQVHRCGALDVRARRRGEHGGGGGLNCRIGARRAHHPPVGSRERSGGLEADAAVGARHERRAASAVRDGGRRGCCARGARSKRAGPTEHQPTPADAEAIPVRIVRGRAPAALAPLAAERSQRVTAFAAAAGVAASSASAAAARTRSPRGRSRAHAALADAHGRAAARPHPRARARGRRSPCPPPSARARCRTSGTDLILRALGSFARKLAPARARAGHSPRGLRKLRTRGRSEEGTRARTARCEGKLRALAAPARERARREGARSRGIQGEGGGGACSAADVAMAAVAAAALARRAVARCAYGGGGERAEWGRGREAGRGRGRARGSGRGRGRGRGRGGGRDRGPPRPQRDEFGGGERGGYAGRGRRERQRPPQRGYETPRGEGAREGGQQGRGRESLGWNSGERGGGAPQRRDNDGQQEASDWWAAGGAGAGAGAAMGAGGSGASTPRCAELCALARAHLRVLAARAPDADALIIPSARRPASARLASSPSRRARACTGRRACRASSACSRRSSPAPTWARIASR